MSAFNWTQLIPGVGHEYEIVATLGIASTAIIAAGLVARAQLGHGEQAVTPIDKFSFRGIFEIVTELIANLAEMVIGKHGLPYVPAFAALFTFILFNNLVGIIPGMTPATENFNTTFAIGLFSFVVYNFYGLKENGKHHIMHLFGPKLPVYLIFVNLLMFPIEIISNALRPLTLGLRLSNVLTGDHTVLGVILNMAPVIVPIVFYILGLFVCFIQAFVFTLLSMVYVAMATAHEEEH